MAVEDEVNLHDSDQVGHVVEVISNKLSVTSRLDLFPSLDHFSSQFLLGLKSQLNLGHSSVRYKFDQGTNRLRSSFVTSKYDSPDLCNDFFIA